MSRSLACLPCDGELEREGRLWLHMRVRTHTHEKYTCQEVTNSVEKVIQKLMGILLHHIIKQNYIKREMYITQPRARWTFVPFSFLTLVTNFLG